MGIIRKTQASKLILNEFKKDSNAISAIELIKRLKSKINKTTVYRLLDKLADEKSEEMNFVNDKFFSDKLRLEKFAFIT